MRLISRDGDDVVYAATFWEAPLASDRSGRYKELIVSDKIVPRYKAFCVDGIWYRRKVGDRLLNTDRSVSYYSALEKALKIKWGEV